MIQRAQSVVSVSVEDKTIRVQVANAFARMGVRWDHHASTAVDPRQGKK